MLPDHFTGGLAQVENDEAGQRSPLQGRGTFQQGLIIRCDPGNQAV